MDAELDIYKKKNISLHERLAKMFQNNKTKTLVKSLMTIYLASIQLHVALAPPSAYIWDMLTADYSYISTHENTFER